MFAALRAVLSLTSPCNRRDTKSSFKAKKKGLRAVLVSRQTCVLLPFSICQFSGTRLNSIVQTAAAIITLLNDFLVSHGKNPLGFLNIWLYEAGLYWDGLNDVIGGNNPGSDTIGFTAGLGWDPVRPAWLLSLLFRFH